MTAEREALRSQEWFGGADETGLLHRAAIRSGLEGHAAVQGRPVIAVTSSGSALNPCNAAMDDRIAGIVAGIESAGGVAVTLPTMTLGEDLMKPSAMLYRNLLAMEVEEYLRSYPIDGVVVTGICDKSLPGGLMGALSADLPTIVHAGGARAAACLAGRDIGTTDVWRLHHERTAGRLTDGAWTDLEDALARQRGGCNVMGTASTMALLIEALGLILPGTAIIPAGDPAGVVAARETGRRAVELVRQDLRPSSLIGRSSFLNAAATLAAIGGSTNAVLHLLALAGRAGVELTLEDLHEAAERVPVVVDVEPAGAHLIQALHRAGGLPATLRSIARHLDLDAWTADGRRLSEVTAAAREPEEPVRGEGAPVTVLPALAVVHGSLALNGAVIKTASASSELLRHEGPALVFDGYHDMRTRIEDPDLDVTPDTVLVLRGCGPVGAPGMPEWGMIPIPPKLATQGVTDMVRITDARMSGTSYGTVVLHVAPEAAVGGALSVVQDGDLIRLDIPSRRLDLLVDQAELDRRTAAWEPQPTAHTRGWTALYRDHVLQADRGCDLDFLVPTAGAPRGLVPPVVGRS